MRMPVDSIKANTGSNGCSTCSSKLVSCSPHGLELLAQQQSPACG